MTCPLGKLGSLMTRATATSSLVGRGRLIRRFTIQLRILDDEASSTKMASRRKRKAQKMPVMPLTFGITGIFWALRFRLEAIFVLLASSSNILNWIVKRLIKRPRPTSELVTVARVINEPSFPSGHVMHYVNFFGLLNYLLATNWRSCRLRNILLTISTAFIVLVGPSRVYLGAHWPSDVMAGYIYGGLWFGGIMALYLRVKSWIHPPEGKTPEAIKSLKQPGEQEE